MNECKCQKCFVFLRDFIESTTKNKYFRQYHLDEFTQYILDFTRCISKSALYGAKARANLYMKSTNILYYSYLLKVIKGTTVHTRFEKEFAYLRVWLVEKNFEKSDSRNKPFENIDIYLDLYFMRFLDCIYDVHEAHSNPQYQTTMIETVEEDDWAEYEAISS